MNKKYLFKIQNLKFKQIFKYSSQPHSSEFGVRVRFDRVNKNKVLKSFSFKAQIFF